MNWLILFCALSSSTSLLAASYSLPADSKVLNVRDFGAVGDGKTDDTAAIQAAIVQAHTTNRYAYPQKFDRSGEHGSSRLLWPVRPQYAADRQPI